MGANSGFQGLDGGSAFTSATTANSLAFTQNINVNAGTYLVRVTGMMNSDATNSDGIIHADFDGANLSSISVKYLGLNRKT